MFRRSGLVEQEHSGLILHLNKNGIIKQIGKPNDYKFFQRSCMKPLHLAELIDMGLDKQYDFSLAQIAVMASSHVGDVEHQEAAEGILNKLGLKKSDLLCPDQIPLSVKEQNRLLFRCLAAEPLHNNCSGKHAAMLAI